MRILEPTTLHLFSGMILAAVVVRSLTLAKINTIIQRKRRRDEEAKKRNDSECARNFLPKKDFTPEELAKYDGTDPELPIAICCGGRVFNVSSGRRIYGIGGNYHALAGRDASRMLARGTLVPEEASDKLKPLTHAERLTLRDWREHFAMRYETLGCLRTSLNSAKISY